MQICKRNQQNFFLFRMLKSIADGKVKYTIRINIAAQENIRKICSDVIVNGL